MIDCYNYNGYIQFYTEYTIHRVFKMYKLYTMNKVFAMYKVNGVFFFLLDHFLDLFESKWLYKYKIRLNKKNIYSGRTNILVLELL